MPSSSEPTFVYAGVARWGGGGSKTAKPDTLGGVFRMKLGEYHWEHVVNGFPDVVHAHCITVHPNDKSLLFAGVEVNGGMRSVDGGATWVDCADSLAALSERPELKSKILTQFESEGMLDAHAICISARRPGAPIIATRMGLFGSPDGGSHWEDLGVKRFSPMAYGRDIRVSPQDPATLYACLSESSQGSTGSVCKSTDSGATWKRFDHSVHPKSTVMAVALHPDDPDVVFYAARQAQVFGTEDGGKTWREHAMPSACKGVYAIACA